MNKNNLTKSLFATLLLVSGVVSADEQYPAADFQPSVVYQDSSYVKNGSSSQTATKQATPTASAEADAQYPAANFQPTVVYSDTNYQHNKSVPAKSTKNNAVSASVEDSKADVATVAEADKKKEDSTATYLLGLIGLAAAGFFLFRNQTEQSPASSTARKSSTVAPTKVAANTGVAKYINKVSGTGVSRYLEKQVKTAKSATGVARYVAQQTLSNKEKAADKKTTGVERYMRDRG